MPKPITQFLVLLSLAIGLSADLRAEQMQTFDNYAVHYSVFNSAFITPTVAQAYGIVRGKNRAVINIAVQKQQGDGSTQAQKAIVSGSSTDLMRAEQLTFREVQEADAVYYLAEFDYNHLELRSFTIKVQPDPATAPYILKFSQTLYVEE